MDAEEAQAIAAKAIEEYSQSNVTLGEILIGVIFESYIKGSNAAFDKAQKILTDIREGNQNDNQRSKSE